MMKLIRKSHIGRNIKKIREYMGVKQEAIAIDLGINQTSISKIEQQETVEEEILEKIAKSLGISTKMIKSFDLEQVFSNINNCDNHTILQSSTTIGHPFSPIEKIMELYERLLKSEKEKIEILIQNCK